MGGITSIFDRQPSRLKGGEEAADKIAAKRPEHETHLTKRPDRVGPYLKHRMNELTFDEFTPAFLAKGGLDKKFAGVPIPMRKEDREESGTAEGLRSNVLAENMARVLGIDPAFPHREAYAEFIDLFFGQKAVDNMTRKAKDFADREEYEDACIYFRAGLVLKFNDLPAMYGYARILRQLYTDSKKEDYIGNLKAECIDYFEMTTEFYPRFDMGWYYLGYMYLNLGLYIKAKLAWEEYGKHGRVAKDRREIKGRIAQLKDPIEIEKGYNAVLSGRWSKGIDILEPYADSRFNDWWPLWYYLGVAYARKNRIGDAEKAFKAALKLAPRHAESMEELIAIYNKKNDNAGVKKYNDKLTLIRTKTR
ncbi:MAG: tetratricopeptide repeat protein [Clostridiales bacterium]|nr:tetratricopeptide repeat protein [Clostridiales bacterium]